jgi:hypothetical protein
MDQFEEISVAVAVAEEGLSFVLAVVDFAPFEVAVVVFADIAVAVHIDFAFVASADFVEVNREGLGILAVVDL